MRRTFIHIAGNDHDELRICTLPRPGLTATLQQLLLIGRSGGCTTKVCCSVLAFLLIAGWCKIGSTAEVERNWALHGVATQSSTAFGADARRAIDGNENGNWPASSVTHTNQEVDPFWQIDLGASYYIDEIRIFNRADCCQERLHDYVVFFSNSEAGFQHSDLNSTLVENTTANSATAVHAKFIFGVSGDIDPNTGQHGQRQTIPITGSDCADYNLGHPGCLVRYVRIQIAGSAILSLAEVEIIEKQTIPGAQAVADALTWKATGLKSLGGVALAGDDTRSLYFYPGLDKRLKVSFDLASEVAVPGSPDLGTEAFAATVTEVNASNRVFVAARGPGNSVTVLEAREAGNITSPTWVKFGKTLKQPAVVAACNRAYVSWLDGDRIMLAWKFLSATGGTGWSAPRAVASGAKTIPSMAVNSAQTIGLSFLQSDGSVTFVKSDCASTNVQWTLHPVHLFGISHADRISITAYGPHFLVAMLGDDGHGYFASQHSDGNGEEKWQAFEQIPASSMGDVGPILAEAPRVFMMNGAVVVLGRRKGNGETLVWVKVPNQMQPGDTWMGGRPLGGAKPLGHLVMATAGERFGAPAELYVAASNASDHQVYAMNLGRWIASDVINHDLHLDVEGMLHIDPQPNRALDPTIAPNLFEQMVAVLALPKVDQAVVAERRCGPFFLATVLELDREYGSAEERTNCPYEVLEGAKALSADTMIHEWLHVDSAARNFATLPSFSQTFKFSDTSLDPADSGMKACKESADCGGDPCELAGDTHGASPPFDFSSTMGFDDPPVRRWDSTRVCIANNGPYGRRYQGGLIWYDLGTYDHAFIHMAIAYRWYGEDLRAWVVDDHLHGNDQLQERYDWIKANFFGGIEYNGHLNQAERDRTLGFYGMPSQ